MPKHPECYACHVHQPSEKLAACGACHVKKAEGMQYTLALGTAFSLYNFRHGPHIKKAACDKCHRMVEVPAEQTRSDILEINTARGQRHHSACWSCHVQAKESVCTRCHVGSLPF
jgi:Fe2+ or Zn2+ uptake regulation protein